MGELTEVLSHLDDEKEYTMEKYYDESAKQATRPMQAAQQQNVVTVGNTSNAGYSKTGIGK